MNEFGRRLGEGEEAPSLRAARVLLDFIGARPPKCEAVRVRPRDH